MRKLLTNNIGLKLLSVFGAIILWIIVVNVDDPVISRIYTGIPVEIINGSAITAEGKTFEVADDTDTISVVISAERSIIEALSRENIKATADMKNLTFMNTVPIELKTNRFADKIGSISSKTSNLSVIIEERKNKQIKLTINTEGKVAQGYIAGEIDPVVDVVKVSGPESKVEQVKTAEIVVDYADMNESFTTSCTVSLFDADGEEIFDEAITVSKKEVRASVEILETKEIPVTAGYVGITAAGYSPTGTVICDPSSIVVAGKGAAFDNLSSIKIPDEVLSIDGASENVVVSTSVNEYLPKGVVLADSSFKGDIDLVAVIEAHNSTLVELPVKNISVVNLPEGYIAHVIYGEETIPFEVSGLANELQSVQQSEMTAQIDALTLVPRVEPEEVQEGAVVNTGSNDGAVLLTLPQGLVQLTNVNVEVVVNYIEENKETEE